jgi:hypothetical protein
MDGEASLMLKDRALDAAAEGITIADARLPDMPLIYVNSGFERLRGITRNRSWAGTAGFAGSRHRSLGCCRDSQRRR